MVSSLRVSRGIAAAISALCGVAALPNAASAQSLFEALFGSAKPTAAPQPHRSTADRLLPSNDLNGSTPAGSRAGLPVRGYQDEDRDSGSSKSEKRGSYHTVCVRMCDGFYWPVSYAAPRSRLYRDAMACSASCGAEAKLFHYPTHGGQIEDAIDLTGRVYSRLPTAFKYRKALVQGCACKPAPWTDVEQDRHRLYALGEQGKAAPGASRAAPMAAPQLSGTQENVMVSGATEIDAATDTHAAAQPAAPARAIAQLPDAANRKAPRKVVAASPAASPSPAKAATVGPGMSSPVAVAAPALANGGGFWGFGSSPKYTWPGDAPIRPR